MEILGLAVGMVYFRIHSLVIVGKMEGQIGVSLERSFLAFLLIPEDPKGSCLPLAPFAPSWALPIQAFRPVVFTWASIITG